MNFKALPVPNEVWIMVMEYLREPPHNCTLWRVRLVCRQFNSVIMPYIWNKVVLSAECSDHFRYSAGDDRTTFYSLRESKQWCAPDDKAVELPKMFTLAEIVEDVQKNHTGLSVPKLLELVLAQYVTRGKCDSTIAFCLKTPPPELVAQADMSWGNRFNAQIISDTIKSFVSGNKVCRHETLVDERRIKHADQFVSEHLEDIREISIQSKANLFKMHCTCYNRLLDLLGQLTAAPRLRKVSFYVTNTITQDGYLGRALIEKLQFQPQVDCKLDLHCYSDGPGKLMEMLRALDRPEQTSASLWDHSNYNSVIPAPFHSLRELNITQIYNLSSRRVAVLLAMPNLTRLGVDTAGDLYQEGGVFGVPENIEQLTLYCELQQSVNLRGRIVGEGVKVLNMRMNWAMPVELDLPRLEVLDVDRSTTSAVADHLMSPIHAFARLKSLHVCANNTELAVRLLGHFQPTDSLVLVVHSPSLTADLTQSEGDSSAVPGNELPGHSTPGDVGNVTYMIHLVDSVFLPPTVVLLFDFAYSELWAKLLAIAAGSHRINRLYAWLDNTHLPEHFSGPYVLSDDLANGDEYLKSRAVYQVGKQHQHAYTKEELQPRPANYPVAPPAVTTVFNFFMR